MNCALSDITIPTAWSATEYYFFSDLSAIATTYAVTPAPTVNPLCPVSTRVSEYESDLTTVVGTAGFSYDDTTAPTLTVQRELLPADEGKILYFKYEIYLTNNLLVKHE